MERLNKKQKEILTYLDEVYPKSLSARDLLRELEDEPDDILADVKLLEEKKLVTLDYTVGIAFPVLLTITPKGIEKLRETFITRLEDSAHKNPWTVIAIVVPLILGLTTLNYYFENIELQKQNFDLQNQIKQENELKQKKPPTVWLTQEFSGSFEAGLNITPTLYFFKNSDKHFTIVNFEPIITLNGKSIGRDGGGYKARFRDEGVPEGKMVFLSFYPLIRNYDFNPGINDLIIDYVLEIKDMDSQIRYQGNVTTEINSSSNLLKYPSGNEPVIFNLTKI